MWSVCLHSFMYAVVIYIFFDLQATKGTLADDLEVPRKCGAIGWMDGRGSKQLVLSEWNKYTARKRGAK